VAEGSPEEALPAAIAGGAGGAGGNVAAKGLGAFAKMLISKLTGVPASAMSEYAAQPLAKTITGKNLVQKGAKEAPKLGEKAQNLVKEGELRVGLGMKEARSMEANIDEVDITPIKKQLWDEYEKLAGSDIKSINEGATLKTLEDLINIIGDKKTMSGTELAELKQKFQQLAKEAYQREGAGTLPVVASKLGHTTREELEKSVGGKFPDKSAVDISAPNYVSEMRNVSNRMQALEGAEKHLTGTQKADQALTAQAKMMQAARAAQQETSGEGKLPSLAAQKSLQALRDLEKAGSPLKREISSIEKNKPDEGRWSLLDKYKTQDFRKLSLEEQARLAAVAEQLGKTGNPQLMPKNFLNLMIPTMAAGAPTLANPALWPLILAGMASSSPSVGTGLIGAGQRLAPGVPQAVGSAARQLALKKKYDNAD
jgi:hypothetical protein